MIQHKTKCNSVVNVSPLVEQHLNAHPNVVEHLSAAIGKIRFPASPKKFECEIEMDRLIGRAGIIKTSALQIGERALFALRANRKLPSRVANFGEFGQETSRIVVVAKPSHIDGQYDLITAWIGKLAEKEPWDRNISGRREFEDCLNFWCCSALVYDPAIMGPVFESSWKEVLSFGKSRFL